MKDGRLLPSCGLVCWHGAGSPREGEGGGLYILRRNSSLLTYVGLKSAEEATNSPGVNNTINVSDERRVSFLKPRA
jgi:hypothetical protein